MYEENKPKSMKEYQAWVETLLTPEVLSEKLEKLFPRKISIRTIAKERKNGLPVGAIVAKRPLYCLLDVIEYFRVKAEKENSSKQNNQKS